MFEPADFPQFVPGARGHRALDYLETRRDGPAPLRDIRHALGVNQKSKRACSKIWHALYALEENGFVERHAHSDQPRFVLTPAGRAALARLDAGLAVFGLPYLQRSRPPAKAVRVRIFERAA